jgi:hypothetical protein
LQPTKTKTSATLQPTKTKKSAKKNTTQPRQRQKDDNVDDNDDDDDHDNDESVGFKKGDDNDKDDEELSFAIRKALPIPSYPKARHNAEKEEDKGNKPNAQMMHHMRELWNRFLTVMRALVGPNRDLCHGPRYRIESMSEWPKIISADKDNKLWNAIIHDAYECRTEFEEDCRECNVEDPVFMPLNQLSDIGRNAWKYLKDYAKSDMESAIYVPEVINTLTSKGLAWEPGKTIISESMLM